MVRSLIAFGKARGEADEKIVSLDSGEGGDCAAGRCRICRLGRLSPAFGLGALRRMARCADRYLRCFGRNPAGYVGHVDRPAEAQKEAEDRVTMRRIPENKRKSIGKSYKTDRKRAPIVAKT